MAETKTTEEKEAEKRQKQDAKKEAKKAQKKSSQKSQSEENKVDPGGLPAEDAEQTKEEREEENEKKSREVAEGKGVKKAKGGADKEEVGRTYTVGDYDPLADPIVPSSHIAGIVKKELESLGESPTLKALHANADRAKKESK